MKRLIFVECTAAYKYPERPKVVVVDGRRYPVHSILETAKIQPFRPGSRTTHYYRVRLEDDQVVKIYYDENTEEWYLEDYEDFIHSQEL